jgi:hypothetical protein
MLFGQEIRRLPNRVIGDIDAWKTSQNIFCEISGKNTENFALMILLFGRIKICPKFYAHILKRVKDNMKKFL